MIPSVERGHISVSGHRRLALSCHTVAFFYVLSATPGKAVLPKICVFCVLVVFIKEDLTFHVCVTRSDKRGTKSLERPREITGRNITHRSFYHFIRCGVLFTL